MANEENRLFIGVDCGKYNNKICAFDAKTGDSKHFKFRTKIGPGNFDDDMFDKGTFIVQVDGGEVYKIGAGGTQEAQMETTKKTEIHRINTLASIGICVGACEKTVNVAIGIPFQLANIPEERLSYKDFIFGNDGETHVVKIKSDPNGEPWEAKFTFNKRFVYPEGIGVLYEYPKLLNGPVAIIDIGNLNTNNVYADSFQIIEESSFTDEMGGKVIISNLAQTLSSELNSRCDTNLVASILRKPYEKRELVPNNKNQTIIDKSRKVMDDFLIEHVRQIKQKCDTRHWPLDFMQVVCIGGTSKLLTRELKMVFGEDCFIPESPEFVNVDGFLKKLTAACNINMESIIKEKAEKVTEKEVKTA